MKYISIIFLITALLCSCEFVPIKKTENFTAESSTEVDIVDSNVYKEISDKANTEESYRWLKAFLDRDVVTCASLAGVEVEFYKTLSTMSFGEVHVRDLKTENGHNSVEFKFTVVESDNEALPIGEYTYIIHSSGPIRRGIWEKVSDKTFTNDEEELCNLVEFMIPFVDTFNASDGTVSEQAEHSFKHGISDIIFYYDKYVFGNAGELTLDQIQLEAKSLFGITNYAPPENEIIHVGNDMYATSGHGGFVSFYEIEDITKVNDTYEVYVQMYADPMYMTKSHLIKYTLIKSENKYGYCFKKIEIAQKSEYNPYGYVA